MGWKFFKLAFWRRKWQSTPVLPGKSHGQRSLVGYSPGGHKKQDKIKRLSTCCFLHPKSPQGAPWGGVGGNRAAMADSLMAKAFFVY